MRKGFYLLLLGLVMGGLFGLSILAIERYAGKQLVGLLEDELIASCKNSPYENGCSLQYDSLAVSLISLSASAKNVRLMVNGQPRLKFRRIKAQFSLHTVLRHEVLLTRLKLQDGFAEGIGPDSPTFRFIDYLAAPLPPEKDYPGRWKIKLLTLTLSSSSFIEPVGRKDLVGTGVSLKMHRNPEDNFDLHPAIKNLKLKDRVPPAGGPVEEKLLGTVDSDLQITDDYLIFKRLELSLADSFFRVLGKADTREHFALSGDFNASLNASSAGFPAWLKFLLVASGSVGGTLSEPKLNGSIRNGQNVPLTIKRFKDFPLEFAAVDADFDFELKGDDPIAHFYKLDARGLRLQTRLDTPLTITADTIAGRFSTHSDELILDGVSLKDLDVSLELSGPLEQPVLLLEGRAGNALLGGAKPAIDVPNLVFRLSHNGTRAQFDLTSENFSAGTLSAAGLLTSAGEEVQLEDGNVQLLNVNPLLIGGGTQTAERPQAARLDLNGRVRGPLELKSLLGEAAVNLQLDGLKLEGRALLSEGKINIQVADRKNTVRSSLLLNAAVDAGSTLDVSLNNFNVLELTGSAAPPERRCSDLSLEGHYTFTLSDPINGSGLFNLNSFALGCQAQTVRLERAVTIPVQKGEVLVKDLRLMAADTGIDVTGTVSLTAGYKLKAGGELNLETLLPLVPNLDDLGGRLSVQAELNGPLAEPKVTGLARLEGALAYIEALGISGSRINGLFRLAGRRIALESLEGKINEGDFELRGELDPLALEQSALQLLFSNVVLDPLENLTLSLSGDVDLARDSSGKSAITGNLTLDSATFQKTIDWGSIARSLADAVAAKIAPARQAAAAASFPAVSLNLHITAPRNLIVSSNLLGAELSADLYLTGSLAQPQLRGSFDTLAGWFGLRDRQFIITEGKVLFVPGAPVPQLQVLGETNMRTREGDLMLVTAEITGPATGPRVRLSSDRGLSERELLRLLTSAPELTAVPRVGTLGQEVEINALPFLSDESMLGLGGLVRKLTRIDSVSLEPTFNTLRGTIEPTAIARKKLFEKILLVGESSLATNPSETKFRVIYQFLPFLKLDASADTVSTRRQTALGVDLTLTLLSEQELFLKLKFKGNSVFSDDELKEALRISESSRLRPEDIDGLRDRAERAYQARGYFESATEVHCNKFESAPNVYCRRLTIKVAEGRPSRVAAVEFRGEGFPAGVSDRCSDDAFERIAGEELLKDCARKLIQSLRSEGYIGARVDVHYESLPQKRKRALIAELNAGDPVTFVFEGNHLFAATDFLATINLFERRQPFGRNTINILIENIDRLYREAGYLFVTINYSRLQDPVTRRVTYRIRINEGLPARVKAVEFIGNEDLPTARLKALLKEKNSDLVSGVFRPRYALAEELENNVALLKEIYSSQGYPQAAISYNIVPDQEGRQLTIRYNIEEGLAVLAEDIIVANWPADLPPVPLPDRPYSVQKINSYLQSTMEALQAAGFRSASLSSGLDETNRLLVTIKPGSPVVISAISIEGNRSVAEQTILEALLLKPGDAWRSNQLAESRRKLLKSGLFSRVEVQAEESGTNEVALKVKVLERSLTTLEVGGGANSEYGIHTFGQATDRSLFADGRSLTARLDAYYDPTIAEISQGVASFTFANPALLSSEYGLVEDLRFQRLEQPSLVFNLDRLSLASYLHRSWDEGAISASAGHTILLENLHHVPADAALSDLDIGTVELSFLSGTLNFDQRDDPLNPHSGYNVIFNSAVSSEVLASNANYASTGARFSYLLPLPFAEKRFTIASATAAASAWTFAGTDAVPISQRYYLGGRNSVRGFRENSLGPRGSEGHVIGGDLSLLQNLELRYLIATATSVHTFFDAGRLALKGRDIDPDGFRTSTGFGVRYLSPIGPIGLEFGFPLDRRREEAAYQVHFNIGTNF